MMQWPLIINTFFTKIIHSVYILMKTLTHIQGQVKWINLFCVFHSISLLLFADKAPLSKGLLLVLSGLTVMLTLLPQYQQLFVYNLRAVKNQHQVLSLQCLFCLEHQLTSFYISEGRLTRHKGNIHLSLMVCL